MPDHSPLHFPSPARRLDYLDSIRGIAAFYVLLFHCFLLVPAAYFEGIDLKAGFHSMPNLGLYFLHKALTMGHIAVILFFVLSGFVLASSLAASHAAYAPFIIKRIFRIYPAFIVAVLISYMAHILIGPQPPVSSSFWFNNDISNPPLSFGSLAEHLAMRATKTDIQLDPVTWSLAHEMRISMLFPPLFLFIRKYRRAALPAILALSLLSVWISISMTGIAPKGYLETTNAASWNTTLYFIIVFAAGILLSLERDRMARRMPAMPWQYKFIIITSALLCLCKAEGELGSWSSALTDYLYTLSAAVLIAFSIGTPWLQKALSKFPLVWLGRISYSLYLIHVPIIYIVYTWLQGPTHANIWPVAIIISILCSLLAARFMALYIELPFIRLGKMITNQRQG